MEIILLLEWVSSFLQVIIGILFVTSAFLVAFSWIMPCSSEELQEQIIYDEKIDNLPI